MSLPRVIGLALLLAGFISASFLDPKGILFAFFFWVIGTALFARSFLK